MQTETQKPETPTTADNPAPTIAQSVFDALPDSALVRKAQLVQTTKRKKDKLAKKDATPEAPGPLPFGGQTLWRKVKAGTFPAPIRLSSRMTCWRCGDVRAWLAAQVAS